VLQNFGSNLSVLFVILNIICNFEVNLAGFRNVLQNTPYPVCHPAMACLPHWCCWTENTSILDQNIIVWLFFISKKSQRCSKKLEFQNLASKKPNWQPCLALPCLSYILFNRPVVGKTALLR